MRLSIRGLSGEAAPACDVLADWRAETVGRLDAAGIAVDWSAPELPPELLLPARTHMQLTRVLREAVSNVIRHSQANQCHVVIEASGDALLLRVQDNGIGLGVAAGAPLALSGRGQGLAGMERRARSLGGSYQVEAGTGWRVLVQVPLALPPSGNMPAGPQAP